MEKDILKVPVDQFIINTNFRNIIGKGAYGIVYTGTGPNKQKIAAKTINGKLPRILREDVSKLTRLNHKNIVEIFEFHEQDETFWLFMEFCGHGDLNDYFFKNKVQLCHKRDLMHGISKGIRYCHRQLVPAGFLDQGLSRENSTQYVIYSFIKYCHRWLSIK